MTYLLDTNAISDLIRYHPRGRARLASLANGDRVLTCPIVHGEILHGLWRLPVGRRRRDLEVRADKVFHIVPCIELPVAAGDAYARVRLATQRAGTPIGENDLWIAATAMALGAVLVTRDTDFSVIAGLTVEDWTK